MTSYSYRTLLVYNEWNLGGKYKKTEVCHGQSILVTAPPAKGKTFVCKALLDSYESNNPKMYKGLTPSQVLEMLPPKGRTGEVIGMPIKGKTTKKFVGGALNMVGKDTLYGRYWGCLEKFKFFINKLF